MTRPSQNRKTMRAARDAARIAIRQFQVNRRSAKCRRRVFARRMSTGGGGR
jgi:hypothetical protein